MAGAAASVQVEAEQLLIQRESMSSFSTYMVGFVVLILGLALAAYLLNAPAVWIVVGIVILVGMAILMATTRTKTKDPPAPPDAP
jgi:uncharacterized membrane protein YiaA